LQRIQPSSSRNVFYDKNQFIQGQEYPEWLDRAECRLVLSRNCRNTHEIALTSTRPIDLPEKRIRMNPFMEQTEQPKPKLYFVSDNETLQEYVLKLIRKYSDAKYKKSDIVLLSMKAEGCSALERENMIPELAAICSDKKQANKVLFSTVRKFKGLEADVVICIDVDEGTFANEINRSLFYVGTSRAKTWLDILTTVSQESLATAVTGEDVPRKRPQAVKAVRDALCVKIGTPSDLTTQEDFG
jgi:superfamily I DNA/RNA helicase